MKVSDIYTDPAFYRMMTLPFDEACKLYNWTPPWTVKHDNKSQVQPPANEASALPPSS
jgi:hypothetical protein